MPLVFLQLLSGLQRLGVLPAQPAMATAIVNDYPPGHFITPHVDSRAYPRPIVSVSLFTSAPIFFGTEARGALAITPSTVGEFRAPLEIEKTPGSVLVIGGASGSMQHAVVACRRHVSITFRAWPTDVAPRLPPGLGLRHLDMPAPAPAPSAPAASLPSMPRGLTQLDASGECCASCGLRSAGGLVGVDLISDDGFAAEGSPLSSRAHRMGSPLLSMGSPLRAHRS